MTQVIGTIGAAPEAVGTGCEGLTTTHLDDTERTAAVPDPTAQKLPRRLRYEVLRRDNHTCRYCGASAPDVKLTVDHVLPVALGGKHEASNLVTACHDCNAGKASTSPDDAIVADVDDKARQWAQVLTAAAAHFRAQSVENARIIDSFSDLYYKYAGCYPDRNYDNAVSVWLERGLTEDDFAYFARIAGSKKYLSFDQVWRYFCGCCWRRLTAIEDAAKKAMNDGEANS